MKLYDAPRAVTGSQWSSPMRFSDSDDSDEDYAPSMTSQEASNGSITSSVDTEELDPGNNLDEDMDEEEEAPGIIDTAVVFDTTGAPHDDVKNHPCVKNDPTASRSGSVFDTMIPDQDSASSGRLYAVKRRSVETVETATCEDPISARQQPCIRDTKAGRAGGIFDKVAQLWSAVTPFSLGVSDTKKTKKRPTHGRKKRPPVRVSRGVASIKTQETRIFDGLADVIESNTVFLTKPSNENALKINQSAPTLHVEELEPKCSRARATETDVKMSRFTFGRPSTDIFDKPCHETLRQSSCPKQTATAASFTSIDGGFTLGQSGRTNKSRYSSLKKSGKDVNKAESAFGQVLHVAKTSEDTPMLSPRADVKVAGSCAMKDEVLVAQASKNGTPSHVYRLKSDVPLNSTEKSDFIPIVAPLTNRFEGGWGTNDSMATTSFGTFGGTNEPTAGFTFCSTGVAGSNMQHESSAREKEKEFPRSAFQPISLSVSSTSQQLHNLSSVAGSSQSATISREQPDTTYFGGKAHKGSVQTTNVASAVPAGRPSCEPFVFGNANAKTVPEVVSNTHPSSCFRADKVAASLTAPAASSLGIPGQFFSLDEGISRFKVADADTTMSTGGASVHFPADKISSAAVGSFHIGCSEAQKKSRVRVRRSGMFTQSPRKNTKVGATGTGTKQPHEQDRSRDPAVLSQPIKSSALQSQTTSKPAKIQQSKSGGAMRPAYAGSRRILRAALWSVKVCGDRASSAPPGTGSRSCGSDAEMDSEDEVDWLELKRLGGVAYRSEKYEDAAEYYRQSIELLESILYNDAIMYTADMRTDKAKLHANRAASLMMLMQIPEAQRECRRSIEVDATYARAYLRLGRIQLLLGDATNAKANIETARELMKRPDDEESSADQADYASLVRTEANVTKLLRLQDEIKWCVDSQDYKQALVQTNAALALAPRSRKLQIEKARILLHLRKLDQLIKFCTSFIKNQHHQEASPAKTSSLTGTSEGDTKPLVNPMVAKIASVGIELGLLWATTLHYQNKVDDAVEILDALEVVAPCSSHVIHLKRQWRDMKQLKHDGNERFKQGNYQEAVRLYSEAVQIDSKHQEYCAIIYCNRSAAQMGLGRYHTAIVDCNQSLEQKPNFPRALHRRARCHVALKMYYEAVKDFELCMRHQPSGKPGDAASDVLRERNEAKAAIAKAQEEVRVREAAKRRAERQRHAHQRKDASRSDNRFRNTFQSDASSNKGAAGRNSTRFRSSGASSRASFMVPKTRERRTLYDVLGIDMTATVNQIRTSYRKLALVYHPDKAKTSAHADLFKEMTAAYNVLSDESARAKYNRELTYNRFGNYYEH